MHERMAIAGSGTIACGLAKVASAHGEVLVWARSDPSAARTRERLAGCGDQVRVVTRLDELAEATFLVEAVAEDVAAKGPLLAELAGHVGPDEIVATTTSSLGIDALAAASGIPERFCGFHVFNPVARMELVELAFPAAASGATRARAHALCEALGKTPVEVPDVPGFVVNRLLFPYLFSAVRLMEETGLEAASIDACMRLGAGHPMGPLALLDLVGLDVSEAIGDAIGADVPATVRALVADGALGRKAGRGFHLY
jgi:3-hydroxybutyryl-CoA dehydrogenase